MALLIPLGYSDEDGSTEANEGLKQCKGSQALGGEVHGAQNITEDTPHGLQMTQNACLRMRAYLREVVTQSKDLSLTAYLPEIGEEPPRKRRRKQERKVQPDTAATVQHATWCALHKAISGSIEASVVAYLVSPRTPLVLPPSPTLTSKPPAQSGANLNDTTKVVAVLGTELCAMLPPQSRFVLGDAAAWGDVLGGERKWDVVVADPPWPSHSVRRSSVYRTETLESIRTQLRFLRKGMGVDGHIAMWVTNSEKVIGFALEVFRSAGLCYKGVLVWVKTDAEGVPVCSLASTHRRPYELCLLAGVGVEVEAEVNHVVALEEVLLAKGVWVGFCPVAGHSRKPYLGRWLEEVRGANAPTHGEDVKPQTHSDDDRGVNTAQANVSGDIGVGSKLELYSRSVRKGWTCAGDDVLHYNYVAEGTNANEKCCLSWLL